MNVDDVAQVRRFNRAVIKWITSFDRDPEDDGLSSDERRLLYEINEHGAALPTLVSKLQLSSREVSVLLAALEEAGLVHVHRDTPDGQSQLARLTSSGIAVLRAEERRADEAAEGLLAVLNAPQRERLVIAMRQVERLLRASAIVLRVSDPYSSQFQLCMDAYFAELADRYGGFDPSLSRPLALEQMVPPAGVLVMAYHGEHPTGCGALNFLSDNTGSIKRMWVSREYRGLGIGRRILDELERQARRNGVRLLRLENRHELYEATQMYKQFGYQEVEPFNDEFYADHWYEKSLAES